MQKSLTSDHQCGLLSSGWVRIGEALQQRQIQDCSCFAVHGAPRNSEKSEAQFGKPAMELHIHEFIFSSTEDQLNPSCGQDEMASRNPLKTNYCMILITTSVVVTTYILNLINCCNSVIKTTLIARAHLPHCGLNIPELWCQHRMIIKAEKMLVLIRQYLIKRLRD